MRSTWNALALAAVNFFASTYAQCPNQVAQYNPALRTASENGTWFIVPVPSKAVQAALNGQYANNSVVLGQVPTSDKSLFPLGFPSGMHPVLIQATYSDDIRMSVFQIDGALIGTQIIVPYTRRPTSLPGTLLAAQLNGYLAGEGNNPVAGLVPSTVATLIEGFSTRLGQFEPDDAAYQLNANNILSNKAAWNFLPNPVSGPGIYSEAADMQYTAMKQFKKTTPKFWKTMLNQPAILGGAYLLANVCQRSQLYYNNATGIMLPRSGNVTFGPAADGLLLNPVSGILSAASPDGSGLFQGFEGFSACAQTVGFNPENCDEAVKNVDQSAF